ncbi:alpha/beta fold hydrolase [Catalinimonas niigatensis]|uniref:alpha/beta fold hydrolase n=1 Tax=Catalinimonas niigatensis TaxID=1397264 RepID=UPI002666C100|nr:alpha/beta hydrolase [Catalinimonas niigatensis]WPP53012.1 alpha/beta hydrolase [Catalinimonas niigatensis]
MQRLCLLSLLIILPGLYACDKSKDKKSSSVTETDTTIEVTHDGVHIAYQSCGEQDTTLLFVHGWCIDQSYWTSQVDAFCGDYRVVTMDLPGFGDSGKNRDSWTIEDYGQDVAALINQLDLQNVVLVGHSMSGDVILETALASPEAIIALIGVDNFKDVGVEITEEVQAEIDNFMKMMEQDFANTSAAYAEQALFHPTTDSVVVQRVTVDFRAADPVVAIASLEALFDYAPKEKKQLARLDKKLYLINSDATPTATTGLDESGVDYEVVDIHATGHYPMIEKSEEFDRLLRQTLGKIQAESQAN